MDIYVSIQKKERHGSYVLRNILLGPVSTKPLYNTIVCSAMNDLFSAVFGITHSLASES